MKGRSRTNRCFSGVYSATPSAPVSAMTIAGLTPAAPYSSGSARISAYQMAPSPRRLATWKIRRGSAKEAAWFSLRHRPYSAASIRAMNVLIPVSFMWPVQPRVCARQSNCRFVKVFLRQWVGRYLHNRASPGLAPPRSGEPGERRRDQALRRARRVPEKQRRLGQLQFQQARGARGISDQIHARVQQCAEGQRRQYPLRDDELIGLRRARGDFLGREQSAGWRPPGRQQRTLANGMAEAPADMDHGGLAVPVHTLEVGLQQHAAPAGEQLAHVRERFRDGGARVAARTAGFTTSSAQLSRARNCPSTWSGSAPASAKRLATTGRPARASSSR